MMIIKIIIIVNKWEEKVKHNEEAKWIRREEREKENSMDWIFIVFCRENKSLAIHG
jgi:hypothetical protein